MSDIDEFRAALAEGNRPAHVLPEPAPLSWEERYGHPWSETIPRAWGSFEAFHKAMREDDGYLQALETIREGRARGLKPIQPGNSVGSLPYEDWRLSYAMHEAEKYLIRRR